MKQPGSPGIARFGSRRFFASVVSAIALCACGGGSDDGGSPAPPAPYPPVAPGHPQVPPERTPGSIELSLLGRYHSGVFGQSAAEIPAFDPASRRAFIVNAQAGALDVLDMSDPASPGHIARLHTDGILGGSVVNSVAVHGGLVAVAIEAADKTRPGRVALYQAGDLSLLWHVQVGPQPDNIVFTPDGRTLLTANEGEPGDDYQVDPPGSVSVIDLGDPSGPQVRNAGFSAWNERADELRAAGVRIYGPGASVEQDLEPEYIAMSADSRTAWVTLQENNALAKIDIAQARVTDIHALGLKDHGLEGGEIDVSDEDGGINIRRWPGLYGMYMPDSIAAYQADGSTYLVTANEGDARAWGEDNAAYWNGDAGQGFVEEWRVKHLVHEAGFARRAGNDLPPQLAGLAAGALLNPQVFAYCGAAAGTAGDCRADEQLGRLTVSWTEGLRRNAAGEPVMHNALGQPDPQGDRLMYDALYAFGGRSVSIRDENGRLVWDSGADIELFTANRITTRTGKSCSIVDQGVALPCADFFNSNHVEGLGLDNRSDNKGPEPEGLALGSIGDKTFAFVGLERFGGIMVYDVTNPQAPTLEDYINTRTDWSTGKPGALDWETQGPAVGDLGPEGLAFIPAAHSPDGRPLLLAGNEVSGTTSVYRINPVD